MIRRIALATLIALWPALASAQFATIGATPATVDNSDKLATTAWGNAAISLNSTHFAAGGTSTGSANAQVIAATSPPVFSLVGNPTVTFTAGFSITGATTLNVVGTGVINVLRKTSAGLIPLVTGDIIAGQQYLATYDGTQYELQTPSTNPGLNNLRLAKTSAYATVSNDCSATLALGGGAFFPATFNAPSGYAATCAFVVTNEDTAFGKLLIPQLASSATSFLIGTGSKAFTTTAGLNIPVSAVGSARRYRVYSLANPANFMSGTVTGYVTTTLTINVDTVGGSGTFTDWQIAPEIRLWPGQSQIIFNQNNVWLLSNPNQRWKLPASTEICVDQGGSDSNDGLGVGTRCFQHIQFATNVIYQEWDANNFDPNIGLYGGGTGTFTEAVAMQGQITGYNFIRYRTRAANTWTSTTACATASDNAEAIFDATLGFTQTWTCNTSNALNSGALFGHQLMVFDVSGAHKWNPGGNQDNFMGLDGEGRATINGTGAGIILGNGGTITGNAYVTCNYHCAGVTTGGLLSYSGNLSLNAFYVEKAGSVIDHSANPTNGPGTGTISPILVLGGSVLRENGLTPPGGAPTVSGAGVCATTC